MPSKDSTLVRLPNRLVARIDAQRGETSRAAFLGEVLDVVSGKRAPTPPRRGRPTAQVATKPAMRRGARRKPVCSHPVGRKIGDRCGECGEKVA
jgi:hypothetical protein